MRHALAIIAACTVVIAHGAAAQARALADDEASAPPDAMVETLAPEGAAAHFERRDCLADDATCRAVCARGADRRGCVAERCAPQLAQCTVTLPVGKAPSLPATCRAADQDAMRALERQGELLDMDPTLFADSYVTLIRARIACRAGALSEALNLYDEISESLREKMVPDGSVARRADQP